LRSLQNWATDLYSVLVLLPRSYGARSVMFDREPRSSSGAL